MSRLALLWYTKQCCFLSTPLPWGVGRPCGQANVFVNFTISAAAGLPSGAIVAALQGGGTGTGTPLFDSVPIDREPGSDTLALLTFLVYSVRCCCVRACACADWMIRCLAGRFACLPVSVPPS